MYYYSKVQDKIMAQEIKISRFYPYSADKVWLALTDPEAMNTWLMPVEDFQLKLNQKFRFKTKPSPGFDGIVHCQILEVDEPKAITYSWLGGSMKEPTIVKWKLKSIEDGTVVNLRHTGFVGVDGWMIKQILTFGWRMITRKKLPAYLKQQL